MASNVEVAPKTLTLEVGKWSQLTPTITPVWKSSNTLVAKVSQTGLVTALSPGTARITVNVGSASGACNLVTMSGTIPPVVEPPVVTSPPVPTGTNEPAGMTVIDERAFDSRNEHASPHVPAWDTDSELQFIQDPTAPKSPPNICRFIFPAGFTGGGSSAGHAGVPFDGNYRTLYISYWAKYSANWYGHESGINKHAYVWAGDYPPFVMEAEGTGTGALKPRPALQRMIKGDGMYAPNLVPTATIPRGQWFNIEILLNGNDSGTANGSMDWWLDGVKVGSVSGLQYTTGKTAWNVFEIYPVWGGVGTKTVPATQTFDWDHLILKGK